MWIELFSPGAGLAAQPCPWHDLAATTHLLLLALVGATVMTGVLYLLLDVARPLRKLEDAVSRVGEDINREPVPEQGSAEVRRISRRFNAMVRRLAEGEKERATMLAGIAHDLRAPLTRLQFRLSMPGSTSRNERAAKAIWRLWSGLQANFCCTPEAVNGKRVLPVHWISGWPRPWQANRRTSFSSSSVRSIYRFDRWPWAAP